MSIDLVGKILGRCRLVSRIGQGSMGVVYEAVHTTLNIPVAVKVLREGGLTEDSWRFRERFRREAQIAAKLDHPGLVRVLDFGEENDQPYLVMELVRGQNLDQVLRRRGTFDEKLSLQVTLHLATAIAVAHQAGIVHRDLKPSNLLLDGQGRLKISDLGLARETSAPAVTSLSAIIGTPQYMAPESLESGKEPDHRSDLYAIGVILYQILFGRVPFQGSSAQIMQGHLNGTPDWKLPEGVIAGPGTIEIIQKLLEKQPQRRYADALALADACRKRLDALDGARSQIVLRAQNPTEDAASGLRKRLEDQLATASSMYGGARVVHTTWKERLLAGVLLLLMLGIGLIAYLGRG